VSRGLARLRALGALPASVRWSWSNAVPGSRAATARLLLTERLAAPDHAGSPRLLTLRHPRGALSVWVRTCPSDAMVLREVFIERCYASGLTGRPVETILDLGANIGLASAFLSACHPGARVVAVEPLPENAELLRRNAALHGWTVVEAAVASAEGTRRLHWSPWWSSATTVDSVARNRLADRGRVESYGARPPLTVPAVTVPGIMADHGLGRIDVLKLDVEGAEAEVLAGPPDWLRRVGLLLLEVHDRHIDGGSVRRSVHDAGLRPLPPGCARTEAYAPGAG
jgi:FkbM family methyltransferase